MKEIVVSIAKNVLKISFMDDRGLSAVSRTIDGSVVSDSELKDVDEFSKSLFESIAELTGGKPNNFPVTFILEPQDVFMSFVTVKKDNGDVDAQVLSEVSKRLGEGSLDNLYFTYQKIAPFVYQFIAVKKSHLEDLIESTTKSGLNLKCVCPWVALLPQFVKTNSPAVFLLQDDGEQVVALSELGGIYFLGEYNEAKKDSLTKIINELSVYNRDTPIKDLYTLNIDIPVHEEGQDTHKISLEHLQLENTEGFEFHLIYRETFGNDPSLYEGYVNVLNLLPVPVVNKESKALVYALSIFVGLLVVGGGVFGYSRYAADSSVPQGNLATDNQNLPNVLSEQNVSGEEAPVDEAPAELPAQEEPAVALDKKDISIRIENGTNLGGLAGATRTYLANLGYSIEDIGDALQSDRVTTLIQYKTEKASYVDMLVSDMQESFKVETAPDLAPDLTYDILIVVGTDQSVR